MNAFPGAILVYPLNAVRNSSLSIFLFHHSVFLTPCVGDCFLEPCPKWFIKVMSYKSSRALQSEKLIPDLSCCSLHLVESLLFKKAPHITDHSEHDSLSSLSESCSVVSYSFATPWTVACQAPLSMEISRPEYWSVLPFLSAGESSQPKDQTRVFCIAGGFFTS